MAIRCVTGHFEGVLEPQLKKLLDDVVPMQDDQKIGCTYHAGYWAKMFKIEEDKGEPDEDLLVAYKTGWNTVRVCLIFVVRR